MKNDNLYFQSATSLIATLANKDISSVELVKQTIARIETLDKEINAIVVRDFEQAFLSAELADKAIAQNKHLPLLGLPITIKESFNLAGQPTSWGNPQYKNWRPDVDALVVDRLKAAGAVIMGKTNVPFMLNDWQTYNDIYGTTRNPWDLNTTPGGSSGGSAAALAAGLTWLELGSDLGGSIRVPAHYCGVFGHKPSVNLVPLRGAGPPTTPPSPNPLVDLAVVGPLARTATDLSLALAVISGPDEEWDGKGYKLSLPAPKYNTLNQYRVGIIASHPLCRTGADVSQCLDHLVTELIKLGAPVSMDLHDLTDLAEITRTYITLFTGFIAGNMPLTEYQRLQSEANTIDPNDKSISACIARGCTSTHRDWLGAMRIRNQLRQQFRALFKTVDVILCPVMPTPAIPHDHSNPDNRHINIDGTLFPYTDQFAWVSIATLFGLPATVVPIGSADSGLPIGIQVIGDYLEDRTTIAFAEQLEREFGGFSAPPLFK